VASETLSIDCRERTRAARSCAFTAGYALENDTGAPQSIRPRVHRRPRVGGRLHARRRTSRAAHHRRRAREARGHSAPSRPAASSFPRTSAPAVETRHMLLGSPVPRSNAFDLAYQLAPIRTCGPGHAADGDAHGSRTPASWEGDRQRQRAPRGRARLRDRRRPSRCAIETPERVAVQTEARSSESAPPSPKAFAFAPATRSPRRSWLFILARRRDRLHTTFTVVRSCNSGFAGLSQPVALVLGGLGVPVDVVPGSRGRRPLPAHRSLAVLRPRRRARRFPRHSAEVRVTLMAQFGL